MYLYLHTNNEVSKSELSQVTARTGQSGPAHWRFYDDALYTLLTIFTYLLTNLQTRVVN